MTHSHLRAHFIKFLGMAILLCITMLAMPGMILAAGTTPPSPQTPIVPLKPIASATPTPMVKFDLVSYYTVPQQLRAEEPFELHLEIMNRGNVPAIGYSVKNSNCTNANVERDYIISSEGTCIVILPTVNVGETAWTVLRLVSRNTTDKVPYLANTDLIPFYQEDVKDKISVQFVFLPSRTIRDEPASLTRPLVRPDITVQRTWTAKARSTVAELLTPEPLIINTRPVTTAVGGPEFELVVQIQNQGQVEATNIFIDFCTSGTLFNPVASACRKQVPTTLAPGGQAIASQTLAYKNVTVDPANLSRGVPVTLSISYQFWHAGEWVQMTVTPTIEIYLYPQEFPAGTPTPTPPPPYLEVTNSAGLNVREGPDTTYRILGLAAENAKFNITGKHRNGEADWWKIDFNGKPAWVYAGLVTAYGAENVEETNEFPSPPSPTASPEPEDSPGNPSKQPVTKTLTTAAPPYILVEQYQTVPPLISAGRPFTLEVILHNEGQTTAHNLIMTWKADGIVPIDGTGTTRWLADLAPDSTVVVSGQFFLQEDIIESDLIFLNLSFTSQGANGERSPERSGSIALLVGNKSKTSAVSPSSPGDGVPLWLRIVSGFLGLGAGSK